MNNCVARAVRAALARLDRTLPVRQRLFEAVRRVHVPSERVWRHLYFHGVIDVPVGARTLRLHSDGLRMENEIFWRGITGWYEGISMRLWLELARDARVVFDVGAYRGLYALTAHTANSAARVYAFEPEPVVFGKLQQNVALNGADIRCVLGAAWSEDGVADLFNVAAQDSTIGSLLPAGHTWRDLYRRTHVRTLALASFMREEGLEGVDLMKIDVEGAEPEVLQGLGGHLESSRPAMILEVLDEAAASRLRPVLSGKGYLFFDLDEKSAPQLIPELRPSSFFNLLVCMPEAARRLGL